MFLKQTFLEGEDWEESHMCGPQWKLVVPCIWVQHKWALPICAEDVLKRLTWQFFSFDFWGKILCSQGWLQNHYVAKSSLELLPNLPASASPVLFSDVCRPALVSICFLNRLCASLRSVICTFLCVYPSQQLLVCCLLFTTFYTSVIATLKTGFGGTQTGTEGNHYRLSRDHHP